PDFVKKGLQTPGGLLRIGIGYAAVHGARVHVPVAHGLGKPPGNRAFAGTPRSVDRNDQVFLLQIILFSASINILFSSAVPTVTLTYSVRPYPPIHRIRIFLSKSRLAKLSAS